MPLSLKGKRSFRSPKVGDMIDSNSFYIRSILLSHDLRDLWGLLGVTMKVLEELKSPWIIVVRSDGPDEASNTIYLPEILFFGGTTDSHKIASLLDVIYKR
jgi:hypothetical protein